MKTLVRTLIGASVALGLASSLPAHAAPLSKAQQRCVVGLYKAGAGVTRATGKEVISCLQKACNGKLPPGQNLQSCLAADASGKVAKAKAKASATAAKLCQTPPDFGPSDGATVAEAFPTTIRLDDLLGADLDTALILKASDKIAAACQFAIVSGAVAIANTKLATFHKCAKQGLKTGSIASSTDLASCVNADPAGKVAAFLAKTQKTIAKKCSSTPIGEVAPGRCVGVPLPALSACLEVRTACRVCNTIDSAGGIATDCLRFIDGVARCTDRLPTDHSVARVWDEEILEAIRHDTPRPTVHARNLLHLSAVMWDAWRAYGGGGSAFLTHESHLSDDPAADREAAISFAAYRLLSHRYALSVNAAFTQQRLDERMAALGFDQSFVETAGNAAAAVGNRIGAAMIAFGATDGANEQQNYEDPTYTPVNEPLIVKVGELTMNDPNRWQPLALDFQVAQNGIPLPGKVQSAIGMRWNHVTPFALTRSDPEDVYIDPGPPPLLGTETAAEFKQAAVRVLELSSYLTPDDATTIDTSPGAYGNNSLGANDGIGHPSNPITGQPYQPQVVLRGDFGRVLAEFWADGPSSETPPGHWNTLANYVTDLTPNPAKRIAGTGPVLDPLEWDVKLYLALNGAVHDAAIAAWGIKRKYDSVRPISMIRYMGSLGQSSDPGGPAYHPDGLPLIPGLIEVITASTTGAGQRHQSFANHEGKIAVYAWPGQPADPESEYRGAQWVLASRWQPYQKNTFVTPAFAGFVSGHSTFSRAAAEVLAAFTGSPYFPGGLGEFIAPANQYLTFELGPTTDVRLQWATYFDAADQAGQSRLWGGIHIGADDFQGRIAGAQVGQAAYAKALQYFSGAP